MMKGENFIPIETPHSGQIKVLNSNKRFKVVNCGRRWGKSCLAKRKILVEGYQNAGMVAYFAPSYKMLSTMWREICHVLQPVILRKDEHDHQITTLNGGIIDFFSLENANGARGRKYNLIIVDECAFTDDLLEKWQMVLRPTLTDFQGKAMFLSTPAGFDSDFKILFDYENKFPDKWESFRMSTYDNPRILKEEIDEAREQLPTDVFRQEYLAEFILFSGKLFASEFNYEKHISTEAIFDPYLDTYLSWDFNIILSVVVFQDAGTHINAIKEYHIEDMDLETLCLNLRTDFPYTTFKINGDASGSARSSLTRGNESAYDLIHSFMGISWEQFNIPSVNPSHLNSRLECNFILKNHQVFIHPDCKGLITDLMSCKIDEKQSIDLWKKKNPKLGHLIDCFRYHIHGEHRQKLSFFRPNEAVA